MPSLRSFRCSGFLSFFWLSYLFGVVDLGFAVLEQHLAQVVCCFLGGVAKESCVSGLSWTRDSVERGAGVGRGFG